MKSLLITLIIYSNFFYSQNTSVTYSDLIFAKHHTVPETQEYLLKKGYEYMGNVNVIGNYFVKYVFSKGNINNGVQFGVIVATKLDNKISSVEVVLENANNFIEIKNKFKSLGYSLTKSSSNVMEEKFTKEKSAALFSTEKDENLGVYHQISYY